MIQRVIIAGAGQSGAQVAMSLRQGGFAGEIALIGRELHLPYQRPPLSKQILKQEWAPERCQLRHLDFYRQHDVELVLGHSLARADTARSRVMLDDGSEREYDALAICTGARLNRLPVDGTNLGGVHYLRTLDDSLALASQLGGGVRLVVIGGGYIGMEVAASAIARRCQVELIEALDQVMKRSALPGIACFLQQRHEAEGVNIRLRRKVVRLLGEDRVEGVELDTGEVVPADVVMIGVGVSPDIGWLQDSGLDLGRGITVDSAARTSAANVFAAGDVAELSHPLLDGPQVLESVQNAVSQGRVVAAGILGTGERYEETPWFWSEQYDCRLQMAGLPRPGDQQLTRRNPETGGLSVFALAGGCLHAVQSINSPRDYMVGRQLIAGRTPVTDEQLEDSHFNLKDLL